MARNLETVRAGLRAWISSIIRIDAFDADPPLKLTTVVDGRGLPANTCIEYPVKALEMTSLGHNSLSAIAEFVYSICYRYPAQRTLDTLPIGKLEAVYQAIIGKAILGVCVEGVTNITPIVLATPVQVSRDSTSQNDWLVYVHFSLQGSFSVTSLELDPDYAPVEPSEPDFELSTIGIRTYNQSSTDVALDAVINL